MKVIRIRNYGGPEVLKLEETDIPKPGSCEILIKVRAASINPLDWKIREGIIKDRMQLPFVLGWDVAGTVEALGEGCNLFKKGDAVFAMAEMTKGGGYAEYFVINQELVALKPKTLNFEEAAAVPLASLTAWQALFDEAQLIAGQKVLIHAASGGVGSFAVQFAKEKGGYVIATTSNKNIELVKSLGADHVIDYTKEDFSLYCQELDVVLDPIGGDVQERSLKCLHNEGVLVTIVPLTSAELAKQYHLRAIRTLVRPNGERLKLIAQMIDEGKIKPVIDRILTFKEVQEAHKFSQGGHSRGKIVMTVA